MEAQQLLDLQVLAVVLDVESQWNSSLHMLQRMQQVYPAIHKVLLTAGFSHLTLKMVTK